MNMMTEEISKALSAAYFSQPNDGEGFAEKRPETTNRVTRGIIRLLVNQGDAVLPEMTLPNGRRADLVGLSPKGVITMIEIKSCRADFGVDKKWQEYLDYCDQFFFAVDEGFPIDILPEAEGLIIADAFGGGIVRQCKERRLVAARRKAITLRFARQSAFSTHRFAPLELPLG